MEDQVAELADRGLAPGAIDTVPGVARKAVIIDPEGNMITFGEDLSTDDRQRSRPRRRLATTLRS